jgi:hypothetical protein
MAWGLILIIFHARISRTPKFERDRKMVSVGRSKAH